MSTKSTFSVASCLLGLFLAAGSSALAQQQPLSCTLSPNLSGNYVAQFTGSILLPPPFDKFNGPFFRNVRFTADGNGNLTTTTVVANYAGTVQRESFTGTYTTKLDGTFTVTINNLNIPAFPPGTPNTFTFDGIFYNCNNSAKIVLSGVSVAGQAQPNIGSVILGQIERQ
jgi:hypothetical protein